MNIVALEAILMTEPIEAVSSDLHRADKSSQPDVPITIFCYDTRALMAEPLGSSIGSKLWLFRVGSSNELADPSAADQKPSIARLK